MDGANNVPAKDKASKKWLFILILRSGGKEKRCGDEFKRAGHRKCVPRGRGKWDVGVKAGELGQATEQTSSALDALSSLSSHILSAPSDIRDKWK
jgi:hypothetical protein